MVKKRRGSLSPTTMIFAGAGLLIALIGVAVVVTAGQDPVTQRVRSFGSTIVLQQDGSMHVTETITYDFADSTTSHGIERWLPLATGHDASHDRLYRLTHAEAHSPSGAPSTLSVGDGASTTMRVGDAGTIVTGVQTYVLDYDLTGVVAPVAGGQQVSWDVTGGAWRVPVDKATVTLRGPAAVLRADCHEGSTEAPRTCTPVVADGSVTDTAGTVLLPGQGLRVTADFAAGTFPEAPPELISKWSWARAFSVTPLTVGGSLALLLALTAWPVSRAVRAVRAVRRRRSGGPAAGSPTRPGDTGPDRAPAPSHPLPPPQVGVGELILLADPDRAGQAVAATIIDLAGRGRLTIEETGPDPDGVGPPAAWRLTRSEQRSSPLRSYERGVFGKVFGTGSPVRLGDLGPQLFGFHAPVATGLADAGPAQGGVTPMIWSAVAAAVLGVFGLVGTILFAALSTWGLIGVALLLAAVVVLVAGWVAHRWASASASVHGPSRSGLTAQARDFRRYLERVDAEAIRFEESQDTYLGYLSYAVAFDRVDRWVSVLTDLVRSGVRVAAPTWYLPAGGDIARAEGVGFDPGRFGDGIVAFVDEVVYLVENGTSSAEDDDESEGGSGAGGEPGSGEGLGGATTRSDREPTTASERERAWLANPHRSAFGPNGPSFGGASSSSGGSGSGSSSGGSGSSDSGSSGSW